MHANQFKQWIVQLLKSAPDVFDSGNKTTAPTPSVDVKTLHAKIGELTLENSDGMTLYVYVANDPVNFVDPSGSLRKKLRI